jgi:predicted phage terminase large subunit-like protein
MIKPKINLEDLSVEQLQEIRDEQEREKIRTDLFYLAVEYLEYKDLNKNLHKPVCDEIKKIKKLKQMVFLLSRGHLKSSLLTIAWVIQQILCNQNVRIIITNATASNAVTFLGIIKQHLINSRLQKLFPDILWEVPEKESPSWTTEQIIVKRTKIVTGPTILAVGIETSLAGKHADIILFDDIMDENNSQTLEAVKKLIERYKNCRAVLEPRGWRVIVGTRWKREDLYGWMEKQKYYFFVRGELEKGKSIFDPEAVPIFPEKFTIEILQKTYDELGPYFYSCQYRNNPLSEESVVFKEEWVKQIETQPEKYETIYIICDPAASLKKRSDETVFSVIGKAKDIPFHVLRSDGDRIQFSYIVDKIFKLYDAYLPRANNIIVGIETVAFQQIFKQMIISQQMNGGKPFFPIYECKPRNRPKETRIRGLQPLFISGQILIADLPKLKQQLLDYPASLYDDHLDALAYLPDIIQETGAKLDVFSMTADELPWRRTKSFDISLEAALEELNEFHEPRDWRDF